MGFGSLVADAMSVLGTIAERTKRQKFSGATCVMI